MGLETLIALAVSAGQALSAAGSAVGSALTTAVPGISTGATAGGSIGANTGLALGQAAGLTGNAAATAGQIGSVVGQTVGAAAGAVPAASTALGVAQAAGAFDESANIPQPPGPTTASTEDAIRDRTRARARSPLSAAGRRAPTGTGGRATGRGRTALG